MANSQSIVGNTASGLNGNIANRGSTELSGHVTKFNLKEDNFNAWIERLELYIMKSTAIICN